MEYKIRANIVMSRNLTVEAEVSRWDRYLGMTAAMTQVPVPTATKLSLEDIGKPIGVADYQLLIPKQELQQVVRDEFENYEKQKKDKEDNM